MTVIVIDMLTEVNAAAEIDLREPVEAFDYMGEKIVFDGDVYVKAEILRVQSKYYKVTGVVEANVVLQCGRCMKNYILNTEFPIELHYTTKEKSIDDDVDVYYTDGDSIELDEAIQTNVIMNIPTQRLCKETCKGLCPICGVDLNIECCDCSHSDDGCDDSVDARLAVLKDFFDK